MTFFIFCSLPSISSPSWKASARQSSFINLINGLLGLPINFQKLIAHMVLPSKLDLSFMPSFIRTSASSRLSSRQWNCRSWYSIANFFFMITTLKKIAWIPSRTCTLFSNIMLFFRKLLLIPIDALKYSKRTWIKYSWSKS